MKDYIKEIINTKLNRQENENRIREYIQKYFLYIIYKQKIYQNLIFTGETALRFIHKIKRFSEDLDFSLSSRGQDYDFLKVLNTLKREFALAGYRLEIGYNIDKNVHEAFLKFPGLLFENGLSPYKDEKISIKIEIDTNPPQGGREEVTLYNSTFMFYLLHYDLSSMFAGKLHALLCRKYTKGRDWYDLLWYFTKFENLSPNFVMLNNAIKQTCKKNLKFVKDNWKINLKHEIENLDIKKVKNDVFRFLENSSDIELLTKENLYNILKINKADNY